MLWLKKAFMPQYIVCPHKEVEIISDVLVLLFLLTPRTLGRSHGVYLPGEVHVGPSLFSCRIKTCAIKVCQAHRTVATSYNENIWKHLRLSQTNQWLVQRWNFMNLPHLFFWNSSPSICLAVTLSPLPLVHSVFRSVSMNLYSVYLCPTFQTQATCSLHQQQLTQSFTYLVILEQVIYFVVE